MLERNLYTFDSYIELSKYFSWKKKPAVEDSFYYLQKSIEDINSRKIRDAESIALVAANTRPSTCVDIGTADGHSAALISRNIPRSSVVYTVNILPEQVTKRSGKLVTKIFSKNDIGSYYKKKRIKNIVQIFEDSMIWMPRLKDVGLGFIDGCHDANYVISDTTKILNTMRSGGFLLLHDFSLNDRWRYKWIDNVCVAVEKMYKLGIISGPLYTIKNSWTCIYKKQ